MKIYRVNNRQESSEWFHTAAEAKRNLLDWTEIETVNFNKMDHQENIRRFMNSGGSCTVIAENSVQQRKVRGG